MSSSAGLSALLPARVREAARDAGIDLEAVLSGMWEAGRAAWPGVELSPPVFVAHLSRHAPEGGDLVKWLSGLRGGDLYLACGCAKGLPAALSAFDAALLAQVPRFLASVDSSPAFADEVRQVLRERLLCARPGEAPRIAEYAGSGALASFLRVTAVRTALNLRANLSERLTEQMDGAAAAALPEEKDPELAFLKARYGADFRAAMRDAFAGLDPDHRNVLRMRFSMQMTIEHVVQALKVSRATVVRWQRDAEAAMLKETQRLLRERLRLSKSELESIVRLVRSQLQLSISDVLRRSPGL